MSRPGMLSGTSVARDILKDILKRDGRLIMEDLAQNFLQFLESAREDPGFLAFFALGLSATIEYVFPPFPGDLVVLFGAFLVGKYDWSLPAVWIAANLGSLVGLSIDYAFGLWVQRRDSTWRQKYKTWNRLGDSIDRFDAFYRRWGFLCILLNRFLPAIRAVFFVAAGMAGIKYWKVIVLGLLSSMAWNALLFVVGISLGHNWERLKAFLRTYSTAAWIVGAVAIVVLAVGYGYRRYRNRRAPTS